MLSISSFFNKKWSSGPQIWLAELWFEFNSTKSFNYLYHLSLVCACMFHTDCLWISIVNFTVNILDSTVLFIHSSYRTVSPVTSLILWENSCFNLVIKSDLFMFVYMHKPMALFRMVGSECHFFRIFSFSDETISSLTLRRSWSKQASKQEGRHSPAHRRWRALAAKVIQPSPVTIWLSLSEQIEQFPKEQSVILFQMSHRECSSCKDPLLDSDGHSEPVACLGSAHAEAAPTVS